jgi:hypothetical protein
MGALLVITGACAHSGKATEEEAILRDRVAAFWAAKATGDWETAETYIDPERRPELRAYLKRLGASPQFATFETIRVRALNMSGDQAQVVVEYTIKWLDPALAGAPIMGRESKEAWRKRSGQWYLVMETPSPAELLRKFGPRER